MSNETVRQWLPDSHQRVSGIPGAVQDSIDNALREGMAGEAPLVFTVIRDPWSRVVSCYEKKIRGAHSKRSYRGYKGIAAIAKYDGLSVTMTFSAFVEWLCSERGQDHCANRHWMSQHKFLPDFVPRSIIVLLKLESLEQDLNSVLAQLGLPYQPVPRLNSSTKTLVGRLHHHTKDYYTTPLRDAIGNRYADDIQRFGYSF
jgi:hypothetical protein